MWPEILKGWVDLALLVTRLLGRVALVAISAIAMYMIMTKGLNG